MIDHVGIIEWKLKTVIIMLHWENCFLEVRTSLAVFFFLDNINKEQIDINRNVYMFKQCLRE